MSSVNHTPSPWTYRAELPSGPRDNQAEIFAHGDVIGVMYGSASTNNSQENARLVAAAPSMLELLHWLNRKGGLGLDVHERIHAAIAKATGRPA